MSALKVASFLAEAYQAAPVDWLRSCGRIDNRVRSRMRQGAAEATGRLASIPEAERPDTFYGAEQAVLTMLRVSHGVDPRGGTERDQMISAMSTVARELARTVVTIDPYTT